jgi:hypothetical protein
MLPINYRERTYHERPAHIHGVENFGIGTAVKKLIKGGKGLKSKQSDEDTAHQKYLEDMKAEMQKNETENRKKVTTIIVVSLALILVIGFLRK